MTKTQLLKVERAEFFRDTKTTKNGLRTANAWRLESGSLIVICPLCGALEKHGGAGPVLSHCLNNNSDEYFIIVRRGTMPDCVRRAGQTWARIHRGTGWTMTADELLAKGRGKFKKEKAA